MTNKLRVFHFKLEVIPEQTDIKNGLVTINKKATAIKEKRYNIVFSDYFRLLILSRIKTDNVYFLWAGISQLMT